jgi:hypothetical protein
MAPFCRSGLVRLVRADQTWSGLVWFEAKTHLSRLVEATETGAETEVVIARNGRPVARGQFTLPDSIDAANSLIFSSKAASCSSWPDEAPARHPCLSLGAP